MILERWEPKEVSPTIAFVYCLERDSRPHTDRGSPENWLVVSLSRAARAGNVRRPKKLEVSRQSPREENAAQTAGCRAEAPPGLFSKVLPSMGGNDQGDAIQKD